MARLTALTLVASLGAGPAVAGQARFQAPVPRPPSAQPAASGLTVVIKSQHRRLPFPQDIQRLAVGDTEILSAELITGREVLVLGRKTGRTSLIVWFADGSSREYIFSVELDLSVLERTLKLVNPSIEVQSAPDRDVIVLTGVVPDFATAQRAEYLAEDYLNAGNNRAGATPPILAAPGASTVTPEAGAPPAPVAPGGAQNPSSPPPASTATAVPTTAQPPPSGKVLNLLQLETLPQLTEQKIHDAIQAIGGHDVIIRRLIHGNVRDDSTDTRNADTQKIGDTLVLEGRVPNQIALVRVLTLAAMMFTGEKPGEQVFKVVADEGGGALTGQGQSQSSQTQLGGGGGATSSLFGGARGAQLTNQVKTNLGRAKAISVAGGRILSFIEVRDLPQVRVDIRLVEVNRTKLRAMGPNAALALSNFRQPSLNPAQSATTVQGDQAARVGTAGPGVQDVLSFLSGGLLNQVQFSVGHIAVDAALSLLEREGIAQSLSSPSLTVLSGEVAQVQVGGEVPVPTAFAPAFGGSATAGSQGATAGSATPGVFSSVEFVPFGVQLQIRPLVGDDDTITLDVQPLVVTPDAVLTDAIRQSTGTAVPTTAFQTRALRTSSRLQDGQSLIIGGLVSNNTSTNTASTPGLRNTPILGRLFQSFNRNDQQTELIVVVNPVILRTPIPEVAMWAFPDRDELIRAVMAGAAVSAKQ